MIYTMSIKECDPAKYDYVILAVRSIATLTKMRSPILKAANVKHFDVISPSDELFHRYLAFKKAGNWNIETFKTKYEPIFRQEMKNLEAKFVLDELARRGKTKDIAILCYCEDKDTCHRSILAELFRERGNEVICK